MSSPYVPLVLPPVLAGFPDPVLAFDAAERVVGWNPAAERVYGLPADQAHGMNVWMLVPRKRQRPFARALEAVRHAGHWAGELLTLNASNVPRPVEARWAVGPDGVVTAVHTEVGERQKRDEAERRAGRWAAVRGLAGAAAECLPASAGPVREALWRAGRGADPVAAGPIYHGCGQWVLVAGGGPLDHQLAGAVLDAAGYCVVAAADRPAANRQTAAHRDRLRAAVLGFGKDTPAVEAELHRYRALLPAVPLAAGFDPGELLQAVAEAVGQDTAFDPESDIV